MFLAISRVKHKNQVDYLIYLFKKSILHYGTASYTLMTMFIVYDDWIVHACLGIGW